LAKDIIKGMLVKNPLKRLTLDKILNHKWVKKYTNPKTKRKNISAQAIKNLVHFNGERKLE